MPSRRTPRARDRSCGQLQTCPTEKLPRAPLSNRTSTDARSSTPDVHQSTVAAPCLKRLADAARLLALLHDCGDVAEDVGDPQAGDVLRQVTPVRSDVAQRRRRAALFRVEAPRVVRVVEQPVLQVVAVQKVRRADVAARDRQPRLLHERVAAVVERHRCHDAGARGFARPVASPAPRSSPAACPRRRACLSRARRRSPRSADDSAWRCERPGRPDRRATPDSCRSLCAHRALRPFARPDSSLLPAMATTSTKPRRRTASM